MRRGEPADDGLPPIEPNADMVQAALAMRGLHVALTRQGFTDEQAFQMILVVMGQQVR